MAHSSFWICAKPKMNKGSGGEMVILKNRMIYISVGDHLSDFCNLVREDFHDIVQLVLVTSRTRALLTLTPICLSTWLWWGSHPFTKPLFSGHSVGV